MAIAYDFGKQWKQWLILATIISCYSLISLAEDAPSPPKVYPLSPAIAPERRRELHALCLAAQNGDLQKIESILRVSPDLARLGDDRVHQTALHFAAHFNRREAIEKLVSHGADVNARSKVQGWAPLHLACFYGHEEAIRSLLELGANINQLALIPELQPPQPGGEPVYEAGASPLDVACESGRVNSVKMLLQAGAKLNANPPESSQTALHWAVNGRYLHTDTISPIELRSKTALGNGEVIELLMQAGADINEPNFQGETPLDIAVGKFAADTVQFLLEHYGNKIDVNAPGANGFTPLQRLAQRSSKTEQVNVRRVIQLLKDHGADVTLKGQLTRTPYQMALDLRRSPNCKIEDETLEMLK